MWKQIQNFDYEISKEGIVRRISSKRIKKPYLRKDGYIGIQLYKSKTEVLNFQLHRLIAIAFIPNPLNLPFINHKDSNRQNNDIPNLEWVTKQENVIHGYKSGFASNRGIKNGFSKLTEEQVLEIRKKKTEGFTHQQLANIYNVSYGCISGIIQRTNWKHI